MKKHLFLLLTTTFLSLVPRVIHAQIYTPSDRTPQADSSIGTIVDPVGANFNITGGLRRGQNLFHSFTDFSIPTGGEANFINPAGNQSIITRVTGNEFSDLNGTLNTNGANFLLINPNGVVFGTGAQLNVGKAFVTSTASGVDFIDAQGRNYNFGVNQQGDPLLSIAPDVAFNPARLIMNVSIPGSKGIENYGTLQTQNAGQYIGLIGGNVMMNGGKIVAPGGLVKLGGLAASGNISWGDENGSPKLTFPVGGTRTNVTLTDGTSVSVAGGGGGSIAVNAQNLSVLNGSEIAAGISQNAPNSQAGNIDIDVAGNIEVAGDQPSAIKNEVFTDGVGNGGNINIKTQRLNISNSGEVKAAVIGNGNGGNIFIKADDINVFEAPGVNRNKIISSINTDVFNPSQNTTANLNRRGGNITIDTRRLSVRNVAYISADTLGIDKAGDISIKAANLEVSATGSISSRTFGKSDAGNLTIFTNSLQNLGDGSISSATYGQGNAGNLTIFTDSLQNLGGGSISSSTSGQGNAGNLFITTNTLQVKNGSGISSSTYRGSGNAGNLTVNANNIEIDGERPRLNTITTNPSGLFAQVNSGGSGNAGTLRVNTQKLSVSNGGKVQAATFGRGNGGNVFIKADEINVFNSPGITPKQQTNINAGVSFDPAGNVNSQGQAVYARGKAGNLTIETRRLSIRNGGAVTSDTRGIGDAGKVSINATDLLEVAGKSSRLSVGVSRTDAVGNAGELTVKTQRLIIKDEGLVSTSSVGKGVAGQLNINAKVIELQNRGEITGKTASGQGGNIALNVSDYLLMRQNSQISTTAGTTQQGGDGGNINISSPLIIALPSNSDITANAYSGKGGKVVIKSDGLFGIQYRPKGQESPFTNDITASSTFGQSGSVQINTPGIDPGKDTGELPAAPNDASNQISPACSASQRENKFYITGRGGLPPNASEPQESEALWQDAREVKTKPATTASQPPKFVPPAIGWVFQKDGRVRLIAAQTGAGATETKTVCPILNNQ